MDVAQSNRSWCLCSIWICRVVTGNFGGRSRRHLRDALANIFDWGAKKYDDDFNSANLLT